MDPVKESLAHDETWLGLFPGHWVEHGRAYHREGRVSLRKCGGAARGSLHVTALVHGSRPRPYEIDAKLALDGFGDLDIEGRCSCALGYNCRHVVGALIQARHYLAKGAGDGVGEGAALEDAGGEAGGHGAVGGAGSPVGRWAGALASALGSRPPRRSARRLLFLIRPEAGSVFCRLHLASAKRLDGGGWSDTADLDWITPDDERRPAYLSPGDVGIIREIRRLCATPCAPGQGVRPDGAGWGPVIDDILASGRCHWISAQSAAFRLAEDRAAVLGWEESPGGDPVPVVRVEPPCELFLGASPLRFVDPQSGEVGAVTLAEAPSALAHAWLSGPPISASEASAVATVLRSHPELRGAVPVPETRDIETRRGVSPVPVLRLNKVNASLRRRPAASAQGLLGINVADLQFEYLGRRIPVSDPSPHVQVIRGGGRRVVMVERDRAAESGRLAELMGCGFRRLDELFAEGQIADPYRGMLAFAPGSDGGRAKNQQEAWIGFVMGDAEDLKAEGWMVEVEPGFEFQVIEPDGWFGEVVEPELEAGGRIDWFEFSFGVEVGGRRINLLPTLVAFLASQPEGFDPREIGADGNAVPIRMEEDGRFINFPAARLRRILTTLAELYDPESLRGGVLPIHALRAADLASQPFGDELFSSGRLKFQKLASRLASAGGMAAAAEPSGFQGVLRPYQKDGYSWLQFLAANGLAGILADDMGLGKTVQMLCHLAAEKAGGRSGNLPSLIVAPTSVLTNWEREANKFAPGLKVLVLHGASRKRYFDVIGSSDLVVTSYPLLVRDEHALARFRFHALVLDEAQLIKNPRSKAAQVASTMRAHHRIALTGTPVENHLGELWSIFHFLMPGFLGTEKAFQNHYRGPIEKDGDEDRQRELSARVAPLMIRRTKREVAKELPPKTEIVRQVPLLGDQAELYETVRAALDERLVEQIRERGLGGSGMLILDALLKLRQICCDPRLLKLTAAREVKKSAKMKLLMEFVPQLVDAGHAVLIFSQFTSMLGLIGEALDEAGIRHVSLTGSTKDRGAQVDRFQNGEVPVFLISLMAGGTGLNLTRADTVIHYDPWWNPAVEAQASDRAYRIGQKNPVFVYKLITEGTVEEKILHLQRRKSKLLQSIFATAENGGGTAPKFTADELKSLMAPMV